MPGELKTYVFLEKWIVGNVLGCFWCVSYYNLLFLTFFLRFSVFFCIYEKIKYDLFFV